MIKFLRAFVPSLLVLVFLCAAERLSAQSAGSAGSVAGVVVDPSGAAIINATVEIQNPVSQYSRTVQTDALGKFKFENVPYNNYHLTATANGFQAASADVSVRSAVAVQHRSA